MSRAYRTSRAGSETEVLFEEEKEIDGQRYWVGHTPHYIMAAKRAEGDTDLRNQIVRGTLDGFLKEDIMVLK